MSPRGWGPTQDAASYPTSRGSLGSLGGYEDKSLREPKTFPSSIEYFVLRIIVYSLHLLDERLSLGFFLRFLTFPFPFRFADHFRVGKEILIKIDFTWLSSPTH